MNLPIRLLLGPQRPVMNLGEAIAEAGLPGGPVAVIAAGWQEAEADIDDVAAAAGRDVVNLELYRRADDVFTAAPALHAAYRERQDRLQELQRLYSVRLRQTMIAARRMLRDRGDRVLVKAEQRHAIAQLRALDRHHLKSVRRMHARFEEAFPIGGQAHLSRHRSEIAEKLAGVDTVVITGGNVAVLNNRLRLFGVGPLLEARHVVAWSAGAMALTARIVLFHDNAPEGRRNAEIFGPGLDLLPRQVLLPDARHRLRGHDRVRLSLLSRRFSPAACVTLNSGTSLRIEDGRVVQSSGARQIAASGRLRRVKPA